MESQNQIIVKFSSNYPGLFRNVSKYILYFKHTISQESKGSFYIEIVEDGILYIYQNITTFDLLNPRTSRAEISKLINGNELQLNPDMLIDGIVDKQTFPEHGIDFQYNFYTKQKQQVSDTLLSFHQSLYGDNIKISSSTDYDLILSIMDFDDFYQYVQVIALMANGIVSQ